MPKPVLPVVALLGREEEQQPATSAGKAGLCMLGSGMLCCQQDSTDTACRVGTAYPGAREGLTNSVLRCQSGEKMGPRHARGKTGVEKWVAESLHVGFAIGTRSHSHEILQDMA